MEAPSGSLERSVRAKAILLIMAGDVEQNPGPLPPSPESRALRHHFASLVAAIADPLMLSVKLYSEGIIEKTIKDRANLPTKTTEEKNDVLLSAVMSRVNTDPGLFHRFLDLMKNNEDDTLKSLGGKLEDTCNEFSKGNTEQCTLNPPPTKRPRLSSSYIRTHTLQPQPTHSNTQPSQSQTQPLHPQLTSHSHGEEHVQPMVKAGVDPSRIKTNRKENGNASALSIVEPGEDLSRAIANPKDRENVSALPAIEPGVNPPRIELATSDHKERESELPVDEPGVDDMAVEQVKSGSDGCNLECHNKGTAAATSSHERESLDYGEGGESMATAFLVLLPGSKYAGEALPDYVRLTTPQDLVRDKTPDNVWLPIKYSQFCWLVLTSPSVLEQKHFELPPLVLPLILDFDCYNYSPWVDDMHEELISLRQSTRPSGVDIGKSVLLACMTRNTKLTSIRPNHELLFSVCLTGWLDFLENLVEQYPRYVWSLLDALLYCACCSGSIDIVKYLVNRYGFSSHHDQLNPLHAACSRGSLGIVKFLLEGEYCSLDYLDHSGAHYRNDYSGTPLHYASFFGHMDIVEYLITQYYVTTSRGRSAPICTSSRHKPGKGKDRRDLEKSKDLTLKVRHTTSSDSNGNTPLHVAVSGGHIKIVKFLIAGEHCSTDNRNRHGNTPLYIACVKGHTEIVKFLLTEIHCDANLSNKHGNTPLLISCERGHVEIVKLLLTEKYCTANCVNRLGNTPLLVSCEKGHTEIVKFLLTENFCSADCVNLLGRTPLLVSCENGHTEIVKFLLSAKYCTTGKDCNAAFFSACSNGHTEILEFLITGKYCTTDCTDQKGNTPLHFVCERLNKFEAVKFLVTEQHALTNCINHEHNTPLHLVCRAGNSGYNRKQNLRDIFAIVKLLVSNGLDPAIRSYNGNTAIHYACEQQLPEVVKYLLEHCDLSMYGTWANNDGDTPLHLACETFDEDVISYVVKSGKIDPLAVNRQDKTAMDIVLPLGYAAQQNKAATILAYYLKNTKIHSSLEPAMKLFVLGNPRIGKTTLVRALRVLNLLPAGMATYIHVSGSEPTAGVDVVDFRDEQFGPVSVHDLAGQKEYYSSHDALVQNLITSSVAIFVITVKLADSDDIIIQSLQYWMSFIDNCCSRVKATGRVIVVGSWADEVPISAEDFSRKWIDKIKSTVHVTIVGFVPLDCRQIELDGLNNFRKLVQESCEALQSTERSFSSHECAVYAFILKHLQDKVACTVNELADCIEQSELNTTLPTEPCVLSHFLSGLSDGGLLLYLPNKDDIGAGWVILRRETLLSDINGTIFAPDNFKKRFKFNTSTGVVSEAALSQAFQDIDPHMIVQVMTHFEFCQRIEDPTTLSLISGHSSSAQKVSDGPIVTHSEDGNDVQNEPFLSERYYFFPALVHTDYPEHMMETCTHDVSDEENQEYRSGWCIKCASESQFFSPHFLHVLLLRLAFTFALTHNTARHEKDSPVIRRQCTIWRNGIQWLNDDGIEALVEVIDQRQCVLLIKGEGIEFAKQRSSIIAKILKVKKEFCPNVSTEEFILDLSHPPFQTIATTAKTIRHIAPESQSITRYRVADIANAVSRKKLFVTNQLQSKMKIEKLIHFEPYVGLRPSVLCKLFNEDNDVKVNNYFLLEFAEDLYSMFKESSKIRDDFAIMFNLKTFQFFRRLDLAGDSKDNPVDCYFRLLDTWKTNDSDGTFASLRSVLDSYSIFCGRNPLCFAESQQEPMLDQLENNERTCTASVGQLQPCPDSDPPSKSSTATSCAHRSHSTPSHAVETKDVPQQRSVRSRLRQQRLLCEHSLYYYHHYHGDRHGDTVKVQVTPTERRAIEQLIHCGYPERQATRAYFKCGEDVEAAKLWLIENCSTDSTSTGYGYW